MSHTATRRFTEFGRRHLPVTHFVVDSLVWALAIPLSIWLRYDYSASSVTAGVWGAILLAIGLQEVVGFLFGQYRRRWRYGSFDELKIVCATALTVGLLLTLILWPDTSVPRSVPALATSYALLGQVAVRSVWRSFTSRRRRPMDGSARRTIVIGAGDAAVQVLNTLLESPNAPLLPVSLLDDDPDKRGLRIRGVKVTGTVGELEAVAQRTHADAVLIAVPSEGSPFIRRVTKAAKSAGLEVFVLPDVHQLFGGVQLSDIRKVSYEDLLGRQPTDIDTAAVSEYITGRRVLVTGAGGSIGSELCRQLVKFEPSALMMLDRDESGLHGTQLSIEGRAMLDSPNLILADIRDEARVQEVFEQYRPDVVFHAAALKHLPLLETHPAEGWKTNVCGTLNLLRAAAATGVDRFVNISTDKAANPTSVLGYTKRITERLTAWGNSLGDTDFVSVRFGNVLGSNGSVLKAFEAQAANGGPITVTHPDVTRYFMTITEASRLTVYAGAIGDPGEVMILDMGEPVRILDVAKYFAAQHDPPVDIVFTGLRENEKLHEVLIADYEEGRRTHHPLISQVGVQALDPELIRTGALPSTVTAMASLAASGTDTSANAPTIVTSDGR